MKFSTMTAVAALMLGVGGFGATANAASAKLVACKVVSMTVASADKPEGNGSISHASAAKPEGNGSISHASADKPEGNGSVSHASADKPEGNGSISHASAAKPEGNGNVIVARIEGPTPCEMRMPVPSSR